MKTFSTFCATALLLWLLALPTHAQSFEFTFWPGPSAKKDPRFVKELEHPCGSVVVARVTKIPAYKKGAAFEPERVLEVDAAGKVIQRWNLPTDFWIRQISGEVLSFEFGSRLFDVQRNGQVSRRLEGVNTELDTKSSCEVPAELLPSDYARCEIFLDAKTKQRRRLAYEAVCS